VDSGELALTEVKERALWPNFVGGVSVQARPVREYQKREGGKEGVLSDLVELYPRGSLAKNRPSSTMFRAVPRKGGGGR